MSLKAQAQSFGYDMADLSDYVNQNSTELLVRQVTEAKTLGIINIQDGIKHKEIMKIADTTLEYQVADCEMTNGSDIKYTEREISVATIGFKKKLCQKDLAGFWTNQNLRAGTANEDKEMPFEAQLTDFILRLQAKALDTMIWKSDSALVAGNLQFFDGFQKILTVAAGCTELNLSGIASITNANGYEVAYECYVNSLEDVVEGGDAGDFIALCGRQTFHKVVKNLVDLNFFHYSPDQIATMDSVTVPGTSMVLTKVLGLSGTDQIYTGKASHMTFGTDLSGDFDTLEIWYSQDDDVIYIRSKFRAGVQVPFLNEIGVWTPNV